MIPKFTTIKVGQAIPWRFESRAVHCTNRWAAVVLKMRTSRDDDAQFDFLNPDRQRWLELMVLVLAGANDAHPT